MIPARRNAEGGAEQEKQFSADKNLVSGVYGTHLYAQHRSAHANTRGISADGWNRGCVTALHRQTSLLRTRILF
jgi:hypothetical protein